MEMRNIGDAVWILNAQKSKIGCGRYLLQLAWVTWHLLFDLMVVFNWMIPNPCLRHCRFTTHPFKTGSLRYQGVIFLV